MSPTSSVPSAVPSPRPSMMTALARGLRRRCPSCGEGSAFTGYLKVKPVCDHCGTELGAIRADDAPPYFTIVLVGHIIVPLMMIVEDIWSPSLLVHSLLWLPLTALMTLALLPSMKGLTLGLMTGIGIRGDESSRRQI